MADGNMTAKEYLMQYRFAVMRASSALDLRDELRGLAERITPAYQGNTGSTHSASDKLGRSVASLMDAETIVDNEIEMLIATERDVQKTIDAVKDSTQRELLYKRYINGKTFEMIAVEMNYSYRQITRMHGAALLAVKDVLECPTKSMI